MSTENATPSLTKQKKKVGIVGYGFVGKACYRFFSFKNHYDVIYYDPIMTESCSKEDINNCHIAVVCVPTESTADGSCDTSIVEEVIAWIEAPLILLKSTVTPGTTDRLRASTGKRIVFTPEHTSESTYHIGGHFSNMLDSPFFTFGGPPSDTKDVVALFTVLGGPCKKYRQTDATSAELVKYMENCFFATKVVFCYEFNEICKAHDRDYQEVRELLLQEQLINPFHTAVFQENQDPYSGKCLPKDTRAMIKASENRGYVPEFLKSVDANNKRIGQIRAKSKQD